MAGIDRVTYELAWKVIDLHAGGDRSLVWGSMVYACHGRQKGDGFDLPPCGHEQRYYLGIGVEGPPELKDQVLLVVKGSDGKSTEEHVEAMAELGFTYIPAPFYAGRCPECYGGSMAHVRFADDETLPEPIPAPAGERYFRIPDPALAEHLAREGYSGAELVTAPLAAHVAGGAAGG